VVGLCRPSGRGHCGGSIEALHWPTAASAGTIHRHDEVQQTSRIRRGGVAGEDLPILFQQRGTYCGVRDRLRVVVRDEARMAMLPVPAVPVDFSRQMVLFVTLGRVFSDRYGVRIERVWREGRVIRGAIEETYPPPGEAGPLRPCSPYHLVVVPRSELNVEGFATEIPARALEAAPLQP